jgi:mannose-6-phosphate isomerase-like protein (cupin superfamily)
MIATGKTASPHAAQWLPIIEYSLALKKDATWQSDATGLEYRDLGLSQASNQVMQARELRAGDRVAALPASNSPFHFLYIVHGTTRLVDLQGNSTELAVGDCIHQRGLTNHHHVELGPQSLVLELMVTGQPRLNDQPFRLVTDVGEARPVVNRDVPDSYIKGSGPRSYFLYRDLEVSAATNRRIHIHALKATAPSQGAGTGTHHHTMCQLFYVYGGWADLEVQNRPSVRMRGGDAMCIAAGMHHNVPAFSEDYAIVEVCIPADYDTVDD